MSNFWAEGWVGPESEHYRRKRDVARRWLDAETSKCVRQWTMEYIELLSTSIDRAELREEREF